jgi:hypothetical protein
MFLLCFGKGIRLGVADQTKYADAERFCEQTCATSVIKVNRTLNEDESMLNDVCRRTDKQCKK